MIPFQTIAEALDDLGRVFPQNTYVFQDMKGVETTLSFPDIRAQTASRAAALQALGLSVGDRFGLIVIEPQDFVLTFLASLRVGVIPVPLYPPMSLGNLDAYAARTARILEAAGARVLVTSKRLQNLLWSQIDAVESLDRLVVVEALAEGDAAPEYPALRPDDIAFLQYTSGSTSDPKGVIVTHAALLANVECIVMGLSLDPVLDKGVSWLPLYHDMGLIGFVLVTICRKVNTVFLPAVRFIRKPRAWFDAIHRHRGTISFAPNFAYAMMVKKTTPEQRAGWDLSCMKAFGCGAEPIHPDTMETFTQVFSRDCAMPESALMPAYGMAEFTLCISMKPLRDRFHVQEVSADTFRDEGQVTDAGEGEGVLSHVACGPGFPGHEIAIYSPDDERLPEGVEGEIRVRGPSVCPGYFESPEATAEAFVGGWLRTGDLGYLLGGQIYVTGRIKDLIILRGRNVHPQSVEWAVASVEGVRKGNVVAFSAPGQRDAGGERLIIALETRAEDPAALQKAVRRAVQRTLSIPPSEIVCLPPGALPKTSSGKLQRRRTRAQYLDGRLGAEGSRGADSAADKLTLARHMARSVWTRTKSGIRNR